MRGGGAQTHPAAYIAQRWTLAVAVVLSACIVASVFQTGFLTFAVRTSPRSIAQLETPVVWTLAQEGGVTHVARQAQRTQDGLSVLLSSGVTFGAFSGVVSVGDTYLRAYLRVNATST